VPGAWWISAAGAAGGPSAGGGVATAPRFTKDWARYEANRREWQIDRVATVAPLTGKHPRDVDVVDIVLCVLARGQPNAPEPAFRSDRRYAVVDGERSARRAWQDRVRSGEDAASCGADILDVQVQWSLVPRRFDDRLHDVGDEVRLVDLNVVPAGVGGDVHGVEPARPLALALPPA
jgi:hypothetical protein